MSDGFVKLLKQRFEWFIKNSGSNLGQTVSICDEYKLADKFENESIVLFITQCD